MKEGRLQCIKHPPRVKCVRVPHLVLDGGAVLQQQAHGGQLAVGGRPAERRQACTVLEAETLLLTT